MIPCGTCEILCNYINEVLLFEQPGRTAQKRAGDCLRVAPKNYDFFWVFTQVCYVWSKIVWHNQTTKTLMRQWQEKKLKNSWSSTIFRLEPEPSRDPPKRPKNPQKSRFLAIFLMFLMFLTSLRDVQKLTFFVWFYILTPKMFKKLAKQRVVKVRRIIKGVNIEVCNVYDVCSLWTYGLKND